MPVVVDGRGLPIALLSGAALDGVPAELRGRTPVSAVMARQAPDWVVALDGDPQDDLVTLVRAFQTSRLQLVAVTRQGRLAGVVSVRELGAALESADGR